MRLINNKSKTLLLGFMLSVPMVGVGQDDETTMVEVEGGFLLDEMIVTATRRQEIQSRVPVAVTALPNQEIEAAGIEDVYGLEETVPNLAVTSAFGGNSSAAINVRGLIQAASDSTLDTAVGVYQDDVFLARTYSVIGQMLDVERVEVLRGPQGTLFGRNTIGGAVQIVSKKPQVGDVADAYIRVGAGNYGLTEVTAAGTAQISDTFAMRFAGNISQRDGYTTSYLVDDSLELNGATIGAPGQGGIPVNNPNAADLRWGYIDGVSPVLDEIDTDDRDNTAFRVSAQWQPSYTTRVDLSYYRSENDTNGVLQRNRVGDLASVDPGSLDVRTQGREYSALTENDFYSALTNVVPNGDDELELATASIDYQISDSMGLRLIASQAKITVDEVGNTDGFVNAPADNQPPAATFLLSSIRDQEAEQSTFELQLSGENDSGTINWITGLYYFEEEADDFRIEQISSPALEILTSPSQLPPGLEALAPLVGGIPSTVVDVLAVNESASVFGSVTWAVNDRFRLRVGGRYTEDTKGYNGASVAVGPPIPEGVELCIYTNIPTSVQPCSLVNEADFENFTWDISADYSFSDSTFGYAKVGTGYRTGGISLNANSLETAQPFDEDQVISYEVGLKTDIGDRAQVNAAVFFIDYDDVQQSILSTNNASCIQTPGSATGVLVTCNLGNAQSAGFEVEGVWQVTDSFGIKANAGYTDFSFDEGNTQRLYTPEYTYSISGIYDSRLAGIPVRAVVSYNVSDDYFTTGDPTFDSELSVAEGYSLLNASLSFQLTENMNLSLWGRNLTEDEYLNFATAAENQFSIFASGYPGAPRTFGVDLQYDF